VVEARRRREIDPTLTLLRDLCIEADRDAETDPEVKKRIADLLHFLEVMTNWYDQLRKLPNDTLMQLVKLGDSVVKLLKFKN